MSSVAYLRKELEFIAFTLTWVVYEALGWMADITFGAKPAPDEW
jgi:hypothetical protein